MINKYVVSVAEKFGPGACIIGEFLTPENAIDAMAPFAAYLTEEIMRTMRAQLLDTVGYCEVFGARGSTIFCYRETE